VLYYLIYVSYAVNPFTEKDLISLLKKSRENNQNLGVTGMLIYLDGKFIQVLEGRKKDVEFVFEKIANDPTHKQISVILEGELEKRNFEEWKMGFKVLNQKEFENLSGFRNPESFFEVKDIGNKAHPALIFLKLFYDKNNQDLMPV
jgi:hypothetical protein